MSCKNYAAASYIPTVVATDRYLFWTGALSLSAFFMFVYSCKQRTKMHTAFGSYIEWVPPVVDDVAPADNSTLNATLADNSAAEAAVSTGW